jgi:hypothetical protein
LSEKLGYNRRPWIPHPKRRQFVLIEANGAVVSKDEPMTGSDLKWTPSAGPRRSVFNWYARRSGLLLSR